MKKNSAKKFFSLLNIQILLGALTNSEGLNSEVGFQNQLPGEHSGRNKFFSSQQNQVDRIFNPGVYKSQFRTHMPRYSFCVPSSSVFFSPVASGLVHF